MHISALKLKIITAEQLKCSPFSTNHHMVVFGIGGKYLLYGAQPVHVLRMLKNVFSPNFVFLFILANASEVLGAVSNQEFNSIISHLNSSNYFTGPAFHCFF